MASKENAERAVKLLKQGSEMLSVRGETRMPQKSDFSDAEFCLIKQSLGPWPRALEAAGIKAPSDHTKHMRTVHKRISARDRVKELPGKED